jgi:phosphatidylinositol kinase/protein kinase (PI-3  family)
MEVLRRNKDSLLAVLEAFVWDPLINWRLMQLAAAAAAAAAPTSVRGGQLRVGPLPAGSGADTGGGQRTTIGAPSIPNRRVRADENVSSLPMSWLTVLKFLDYIGHFRWFVVNCSIQI